MRTRRLQGAVALCAMAVLVAAPAAAEVDVSNLSGYQGPYYHHDLCTLEGETDSYQSESTEPYQWPFTLRGGEATCVQRNHPSADPKVWHGRFDLEGEVYDWYQTPSQSPLFDGDQDFCHVMVNGKATITLDGDPRHPFTFAFRGVYHGFGPTTTKSIIAYSGTDYQNVSADRQIGNGVGEFRPTPVGSEQWQRACVPSDTMSGFSIDGYTTLYRPAS